MNHVPVLDEHPVLQTNDIGGDPIRRRTKARETTMDNHEISPGEGGSCLILQGGRKALDEIEQTLSARLNMSAVLNVVRRPITFSRPIITSLEQRVERFQDKLFVVLLCLPLHRNPLLPSRFHPPSTGILAS